MNISLTTPSSMILILLKVQLKLYFTFQYSIKYHTLLEDLFVLHFLKQRAARVSAEGVTNHDVGILLSGRWRINCGCVRIFKTP